MTGIPPLPSMAWDHIQDNFERFHSSNPHVYSEMVRLARKMKAAGKQRYSVDGIGHVLRWNMDLTTQSSDAYKLNNSLMSRYARLIMQQEPDLAGFFETRVLATERN
jgi:hypothetical protein